MTEYTLQYDVYTLNDKLLLPAGTILTADTLKKLGEAGKKNGVASQTFRLADYGSIRKDLLDFIGHPPYDIIFSDFGRTASVLRVIKEIYLALPVLESLDYFKEKDFYTYRHMLLVFALSILLSSELKRDNRKLLQGVAASPSHDFGKICIPLEVLKKTQPLTLEERKLLQHHALAGYVLLKYYLAGGDTDDMAARIARDHHERKNGSGYPAGIRLDDPILEIVVVSDLYDALTSPRPYRLTPYKNRTALEEICAMAERGELGREAAKALVACNRREKTDHRSLLISMEKRGVPPSDNVYGKTESKKMPTNQQF